MAKPLIELGKIKLTPTFDVPMETDKDKFERMIRKMRRDKKQNGGKVDYRKLPDGLKKLMNEDELDAIVDATWRSCENVYENLCKQLDAPVKAIKQITDKENMLPYLTERDKFLTLVKMSTSDVTELKREVESIRDLYKSHLGTEVDKEDTTEDLDPYMLEKILDVKLRFFTAGSRIRNVLMPAVLHLSDFHTAMVLNYYAQPEHRDEAPDDVRKFLDERLAQYVQPQTPTDEQRKPSQPSLDEMAAQEAAIQGAPLAATVPQTQGANALAAQGAN